MDIIVGSRGSKLAMRQVEEVEREITAVRPDVRLLPVWVVTAGDKDRSTPMWKVQQTDFFTKEIDQRQLAEEVRLGIHSAKDLPSPMPQGLSLVAVTAGVDPRDSFVMRSSDRLQGLPPSAKVGSSSKRREAAIRALRSDFMPVDIRGTIDERLALLDSGVVDGLIVAEAALIRLGLTDRNRILLSHETEPLQGRLAVVARSDDQEMAELFARIDARTVPTRVLVVGPSVPAALANDPSLRIIHAPFIELRPIPVQEGLFATPACGTIITSKHAAQFFRDGLKAPPAEPFFCVGARTAEAVQELFPGARQLTAQVPTQEGLVALILEHHPNSLLWPRSTHARRVLPQALGGAGIEVIEIPLYTPVFCEHFCSLEGVDELFFTCPSAVDAFFKVFRPDDVAHLAVRAIGPVTAARIEALSSFF
jgi:hydroxymethylbilane synthase